MHNSVLKWVGRLVERQNLATRKTLELGSHNVNGSVRGLFTGTYLGIDSEEGPGVDRVLSSHEAADVLLAEGGKYDVVISTEMLEHDSAPWETMKNCKRLLKAGGTLILTARGNCFPLHNEPDYWRYMPASFKLLFELAGCDVVEISDDPEVSGVFGYGTRWTSDTKPPSLLVEAPVQVELPLS